MTIDCGLCLLRSWRLDDLASLVHHANNRRVWITLRDRFPHPYTYDAGRAWISTAALQEPPTAMAIDVDGKAVGGIGVVLGSDVNRFAGEVGYWLGEEHWGRGLATAAVSGFVPWAAERFGLTRVFADVFENNPASMRVLEKCGFLREGVLKAHCYKAGRYLDQVVFGRVLNGVRT